MALSGPAAGFSFKYEPEGDSEPHSAIIRAPIYLNQSPNKGH